LERGELGGSREEFLTELFPVNAPIEKSARSFLDRINRIIRIKKGQAIISGNPVNSVNPV
jgi:hypothetical protein